VKSSLSTSDVAYIEFFLFASNLFTFFWAFGFKNSFLSYFPALEEADKQSFAFTLFIIYMTLGLLAAALIYLVGSRGLIFEWDQTEQSYVKLISIYLVFNTPTILIEHIYILREDNKALIRYAIFVLVLPIVLMTSAMVIQTSIFAVFYAYICYAFFKIVYLIKTLMRYSSFSFNSKIIAPYLMFTFPLILQALIGNGVEYVDGFLVKRFFNLSDFAVFRYGARELPFVVLLVGALTSVMVPQAVKDLTGTLERIKSETTRLMHFLFPVSIVLILISPYLFTLVYDENFRESAYLFNIYALILISRILLPQVVLFGKHHNLSLFIITFIEFCINVGLSLVLMKDYGLRGIAVASVIAYLIAKIIMIAFNYLKYSIVPGRYINMNYYLIYSIALVFSFYISSLY